MKTITAKAIAILLAASVGFVVSPLAHDLWSFGSDTFLPTLSKQGRLSLVATLSILCLVLSALLYHEKSERERICGGLVFRRSKRTGWHWIPFCPKCGLPALIKGSRNDIVSCTEFPAACTWFVEIKRPLSEIITQLDP